MKKIVLTINIMRSSLEVEHRTRMAYRHQLGSICARPWHTIKLVKFRHGVFWIFDFLTHRVESSLCANISSSWFTNIEIRYQSVDAGVRWCYKKSKIGIKSKENMCVLTLSFRNWSFKSSSNTKPRWSLSKCRRQFIKLICRVSIFIAAKSVTFAKTVLLFWGWKVYCIVHSYESSMAFWFYYGRHWTLF